LVPIVFAGDEQVREKHVRRFSGFSPLPTPSTGRLSFGKEGGKEVPWRKEDEISIMANVQAYFQVTHHARISRIIYRGLVLICLSYSESLTMSRSSSNMS
jgi:hypothetical protein